MPSRSRIVAVVKYNPKEVKCDLEIPDGKGTKNNIFLQSLRDKIVQHDIFHPSDDSYRAMFGGTKTDVKRAYREALRKEIPRTLNPNQIAAFEKKKQAMRQSNGLMIRKDLKEAANSNTDAREVLRRVSNREMKFTAQMHKIVNDYSKRGQLDKAWSDLLIGKISQKTKAPVRNEFRRLQKKNPKVYEQLKKEAREGKTPQTPKTNDTPMPQTQSYHKSSKQKKSMAQEMNDDDFDY